MAKLYKAPIFLQVSLDVTNWPISWLIRVEMRHVFLSTINRKRFDTLRMKGIPLGKSVEAEPAFPPPLFYIFLWLARLSSHLMFYMRKTDPLSAQNLLLFLSLSFSTHQTFHFNTLYNIPTTTFQLAHASKKKKVFPIHNEKVKNKIDTKNKQVLPLCQVKLVVSPQFCQHSFFIYMGPSKEKKS